MDFGNVNKKDLTIAGVVVGGFFLLALLRRKGGQVTPSSTGASALVGGYQTASTVYVPTSSYDIHYDYNYGTQTQTSTTTSVSQSAGPGATISGASNPEPVSTTTTTTNPTGNGTNPAPAPGGQHPGIPPKVTSTPPAHTTSVQGVPVRYKLEGTDAANSTLWGLSRMYLQHVGHIAHPTNAQISAEVRQAEALSHISPSQASHLQKNTWITMAASGGH